MIDYKPFAISNFRTGFDEALEPWLLPRDAYQSVINAHLYRGIIEKIEGYQLYAKMSNRTIILMGTGNGSNKTFTNTVAMTSVPTTTNFYGFGILSAGSSTEIFSYSSDASATVVNLTSNGTPVGTGTVDFTTLPATITLTFGTAPANGTAVLFAWDSAPSTQNAIMGIFTYYSTQGSTSTLIFDQKRVGTIVSIMGLIAASQGTLQGISEIPHDYYVPMAIVGNNTTGPFTGTLTGPFVPGTVQFLQYDSTGARVFPKGVAGVIAIDITDNGTGILIGSNVASGTINYATGAFSVTFTNAIPTGNYFDGTVGIYGDLFTGTISDFFSYTNFLYNGFFCNNQDPIFYYDGTSIHYLNTMTSPTPVTATSGVPGNYNLTTCLHVFSYRQALLVIAPVVADTPQSIQARDTIYWSVFGNPFDFTENRFLPAQTSQAIQAIGYINTDLVVRFSTSERVFRYTGDPFDPFRFDSTNNVWACDAPFSSINYDTWFSTVGKPAIVGSNAVNVTRADESIPDFTDPYRLSQQFPVPFMNQTSIQQCYGFRFDDIKEGWLCYNSGPAAQDSVTASDNVLAFNYMDGTYAVYTFPFSCLGLGSLSNVPTWGTTFQTWQVDSDTWGSYERTKNSLIDLAGDQFDTVYELNSGNTLGDGVTPVLMSVITKNFNPFLEEGQLARLGYVDLLVSAYNTTNLRIQFYVNDQLFVDSTGNPAGYYQENTLTFTTTDAMSPTTNQTKVWKRVYVGAVAKSHTIRFYQNIADFATNLEQPVYIHAMVVYMKPAGRVFN